MNAMTNLHSETADIITIARLINKIGRLDDELDTLHQKIYLCEDMNQGFDLEKRADHVATERQLTISELRAHQVSF